MPRRTIAIVAFAAVMGIAADAQTDRGAPPVSSRSGVERYTASVQGVVTAADSGAPVQGAEVRLLGSGRHRLTMSDAAGRYAFTDLPPERMTLHASKAGFVDTEYGQRHLLEEPEPIVLASGQQVTANVTLSRGGVIYGRVFDQYGEPAAGALVEALLGRAVRGRERVQSVGSGDLADDTGAFRLYGLPPGTYVVSASPGPAGTAKRGAPTYYPGTPTVANALAVDVESSSQVPVSITLSMASLARVSGVLVNAAGVPTAGYVTLVSEDRIAARRLDIFTSPVLDAFRGSGAAGQDGRFIFTDVPPGSYVLTATISGGGVRISSPAPGGREPQALVLLAQRALAEAVRNQESASLPVLVSGTDVSGLTLATRPRPLLSGRFVAAPGVRQPLPSGLRLTPESRQTMSQPMSVFPATGQTDGAGGTGESFLLSPPTGPFMLSLASPSGPSAPPGWAVSAIRLNGRDVTDEPIEVFSDGTIEVVLTDRVTKVTGHVQGSRERDAASASVVVFPRDEGQWTYPSRAIRSARADASGRFEITGLPPSGRYLVVAVDYLTRDEEYDSAFLESVRREATDFTLDDEGDQQTLRLDLVTR